MKPAGRSISKNRAGNYSFRQTNVVIMNMIVFYSGRTTSFGSQNVLGMFLFVVMGTSRKLCLLVLWFARNVFGGMLVHSSNVCGV